jgi:hypothetical protein
LKVRPALANTHDHTAPSRHGDHRYGVGDVQDECCSLHHHLVGVMHFPIPTAVFLFTALPLVVPPLRTLASADPILLERPPKSSSLI